MKKLNLAVISTLLIIFISAGAYLTAKYFGEKRFKETAELYLQQAGLKDKVIVSDYEYNPITGVGVLKDVKLIDYSSKELIFKKIDRIELRKYEVDKKTEIPLKVDIAAYGLVAELKENGDKLRGEIFSVYSYDPEKKQLKIENLEVRFPQFFEVKTSFSFGNLDKELLQKLIELGKERPSNPHTGDLMLLYSRLLQVKPEFFHFEFADRGIVQKYITEEAKKSGKKPEDLKKKIITDLERSKAKASTEFEKKLIDGLIQTVKNGNVRFIFQIKSKKDVTLQDVIAMVMRAGMIGQTEEERAKLFIESFTEYFDTDFRYQKEI
ncbi:hypothetical protein SAMN06265182_1740 [Persephonella hydrogeniphila]|uniref:Uncharacterized protein n=1 Tax=Persephonella hydrogeniphila TaxID=198703 RepID=A0A285NMD4_9AQUI|nr:hypothetical protein [Persephonella hydrogeniphila]SNZ10117.1 hypothetical protein SAMN06265182_1740 [Persephonella hydrogeniphila]